MQNISKWSIGNNYSEEGEAGELSIKDYEITVKLPTNNCFLRGKSIVSKNNNSYLKASCIGMKGNIAYLSRLIEYNSIQNNDDIKDMKIKNIREVRFRFYELGEWLNINTLENDNLNEIPLVNSLKRISIKFIPNWPYQSLTKIVIENNPYIVIEYDSSTTIEDVEEDILCISRFFGILIGRISKVTDISLILNNCEAPIRYYNTTDYSQIITDTSYLIKPRLKYSEIKDKIITLFNNWIIFNNKYKLLVDKYSDVFKRESLNFIDEFVVWCNIIDGYDYRKNEMKKVGKFEEKINEILDSKELKQQFKEIDEKYRKDIAKIVVDSSELPIIQKLFEDEGFKYKKSNIKNGIINGFINKEAFKDKLKRICTENYNIIIKNKKQIFRNNKELSDAQIYEKINNTRNHFAHYNDEDDKCLSYAEIFNMNEFLFFTVLSIILHEIGFKHEEVKDILINDDMNWGDDLGD